MELFLIERVSEVSELSDVGADSSIDKVARVINVILREAGQTQSIIDAADYLNICSLTTNICIQSFHLINTRGETLREEGLVIEYL